MVGIAGGHATKDSEGFLERLNIEEWYEVERMDLGEWSLGCVLHTSRDTAGFRTWDSSDASGILFGAIRNDERLEIDLDRLPELVLERPEAVLSRLDGSFLLAVIGDDEAILATDKLGTRPIYFVEDGPQVFATNVSALCPELNNPTINYRAIADLIQYTVVQGQETLVEEVKAVPAGSYVRFQQDSYDVETYHWLQFSAPPPDMLTVYDIYRTNVLEEAGTISEESQVGMWLSGGLDSRLLAGVLHRSFPSLRTFTYDANPGDGSNVTIGPKVAKRLDIHNKVTNFSPERFANQLKAGVNATSGRASWASHMHNLPFVLEELRERVDVLIDISGQGELFGEDVSPEEFRIAEEEGALSAYQASFANRQTEVEEVFQGSLNTARPLSTLIDSIPHKDEHEVFLELVRHSFYPNFHYRTITSWSQVGIRIPLVGERLLNLWATMPSTFRRRNKSPHVFRIASDSVSPLKLELIRKCDQGLESIPYERTGLSPEYPLILHTFKSKFNNLLKRIKSNITTSAETSIYGRWYRENKELQDTVNSYYDEAKKRPFFDEEELDRKRNAHLSGDKNNIGFIAPITTAEIWLQNNL